jgi:hypothetical protein
MPFTFNEADWTPQAIRIFQMALLERERDGSGQNGRAGVDHLACACAMENNNFLSALIEATGLTVRDIRNGHITKPVAP